jgi:hypothetical protein
MGQANHSQLPNTIWVWQLGWLASQPGCQLGGKHHLHLGRAEMVQARKQGALHRLGQVIPDLGWLGQPGWFGPGSQTRPRSPELRRCCRPHFLTPWVYKISFQIISCLIFFKFKLDHSFYLKNLCKYGQT